MYEESSFLSIKNITRLKWFNFENEASGKYILKIQ